jgi:hypothetical protein
MQRSRSRVERGGGGRGGGGGGCGGWAGGRYGGGGGGADSRAGRCSFSNTPPALESTFLPNSSRMNGLPGISRFTSLMWSWMNCSQGPPSSHFDSTLGYFAGRNPWKAQANGVVAHCGDQLRRRVDVCVNIGSELTKCTTQN